MYTVDYFINKFEAIPESRWTTNFFDQDDKYCANGHCGMRESELEKTREALALAELLKPLKRSTWSRYGGDPIYEVTANINDGETAEYPQPTPKQRILAALYDIKAMREKEKAPEQKVKTVYVSVPVTITEQAKELIEN